MDWKNRLYFDDNLDVPRQYARVPPSGIDLIYLDPPFNSDATYNALFKEKSSEESVTDSATITLRLKTADTER